jgi:hypothetical protein
LTFAFFYFKMSSRAKRTSWWSAGDEQTDVAAGIAHADKGAGKRVEILA